MGLGVLYIASPPQPTTSRLIFYDISEASESTRKESSSFACINLKSGVKRNGDGWQLPSSKIYKLHQIATMNCSVPTSDQDQELSVPWKLCLPGPAIVHKMIFASRSAHLLRQKCACESCHFDRTTRCGTNCILYYFYKIWPPVILRINYNMYTLLS